MIPYASLIADETLMQIHRQICGLRISNELFRPQISQRRIREIAKISRQSCDEKQLMQAVGNESGGKKEICINIIYTLTMIQFRFGN